MELAVDSLLNSTNNSFVFVDININKNEEKTIQSLIINDDLMIDTFSYFGKFNITKLDNLINNFILSIGNNIGSSNKITNILLNNIIKPYVEATNKNYIWFTIKIFFSEPYFDIPRWHTDGYFYNPEYYTQNNLPQIKLVGSLKGCPTLFKENSKEMRTKYYKLFKSLHNKNNSGIENMENRKILDNALKEYNHVYPLKNQAAIFIVGLKDRSAVHSEPKINTKRLFYSVLTGNREEIKDLATNWKVQFQE